MHQTQRGDVRERERGGDVMTNNLEAVSSYRGERGREAASLQELQLKTAIIEFDVFWLNKTHDINRMLWTGRLYKVGVSAKILRHKKKEEKNNFSKNPFQLWCLPQWQKSKQGKCDSAYKHWFNKSFQPLLRMLLWFGCSTPCKLSIPKKKQACWASSNQIRKEPARLPPIR